MSDYLIKDNFLAFLKHKEQEFKTKHGKEPKILVLTVKYFDLLVLEFEDLNHKYDGVNGDFFKGLPIFQTVKNNTIEFY